jgi:hypothetical protein
VGSYYQEMTFIFDTGSSVNIYYLTYFNSGSGHQQLIVYIVTFQKNTIRHCQHFTHYYQQIYKQLNTVQEQSKDIIQKIKFAFKQIIHHVSKILSFSR